MMSIGSIGAGSLPEAAQALSDAAERLQDAVALPEEASGSALIVQVTGAGAAVADMKVQTYALKAGMASIRTTDERFQTLLDNVVGPASPT